MYSITANQLCTSIPSGIDAAHCARLVAFLLLGALGGMAHGTTCALPSATDGTYDVTSRTDLEAIGTSCPMDGAYRLTTDVNLSGTNWVPIGWSASSTDVVPFTGSLDGRGHAITNLTISSTSGVRDAGLFARLQGATIRSLSLKDVRILQNGGSHVGGLAGGVSGSDVTIVRDIAVTGRVRDSTIESEDIGGMMGYVYGPLELQKAHLAVDVGGYLRAGGVIGRIGSNEVAATITLTDISIQSTAHVESGYDVGGLVGRVDANVRVSRATVAGHIEGSNRVGGLFGRVFVDRDVVATDVEVTKEARVEGGSDVGGLVGRVHGSGGTSIATFSDLTVAGVVTGEADVGGAFGEVSEPVVLHRARIAAQVSSTGSQAGGISGDIGRNRGDLLVTESIFDGSVTGGSETGAIIGAYHQGADAFTMRDVLVIGPATSTADGDLGGLIGSTNKDADLRRVLVRSPLTAPNGAKLGALVGHVDGSTVSVIDSFWSRTVNPDVPAAGSGTVAGNARGGSTDTLQTYATFTEAGWSIANGRPAVEGPADATWTLCRDATPTLTRWAPERCLPASNDVATLRIGGFDPRQLRNIPFDVVVSLTDAAGSVAYAETPSTLTLTADGGAESGDLLTYPEGADTPTTPQVTVPAGAAHVTFTDVFYTGLSGPDGRDVTLTATGEDGPLEGTQVATNDLSIRDVDMTLGVSPTTLLLNGADVATVTVTLTDAEGTPLDGQPITLTTTSGGLGPDATPTLVRRTDQEGRIQATLTPTGRAGTATLTARCPGACPRTTTLTFTGEIDELRAVPGDQEAWLYFSPLADGVTNVRYRIDQGPWITVDPPRTQGPVHVAPQANGVDLRNGVPHEIELQGLERDQTTSDLPIAGPITFTPTDVERPQAAWARLEGGEVDAGFVDDRTRVTLDASLTNETGGPLHEVWIDTPSQSPWALGDLRVTDEDERATHGTIIEREENGWYVRFTRAPLLAGDTLALTLDLDERSGR